MIFANPTRASANRRTRRRFMGAAMAAAVAGAAGCGTGTWRFFSEREARTLEAMLGRIIPSDDAPGAREAGTLRYIDRQLSGFFRRHRKAYRDGIAAAGRLAGGDYASVPPERQDAILRQLERDSATRPFFDLLLAHSMQGFYGNPRHGGNRDFASWRMLGIPPVPVRGRSLYDFTKGTGDAKS
jgi:gluconate 2-dehydrogenase gamma chain